MAGIVAGFSKLVFMKFKPKKCFHKCEVCFMLRQLFFFMARYSIC